MRRSMEQKERKEIVEKSDADSDASKETKKGRREKTFPFKLYFSNLLHALLLC